MIRVTLDQDSAWYLRALQRTCPRTMRAACGAAATRARKRFVKVMRSGGGVYGVGQFAPLSPVSTYIRPRQRLGGRLADDRRIVMFRRGKDEQVIGWPDALARWAVLFQSADTHPLTNTERAYFRWRRVPRDMRGETYRRPERDVVDSFGADLARDWPGMVNEMFQKKYMSRRAKFGAGSVK